MRFHISAVGQGFLHCMRAHKLTFSIIIALIAFVGILFALPHYESTFSTLSAVPTHIVSVSTTTKPAPHTPAVSHSPVVQVATTAAGSALGAEPAATSSTATVKIAGATLTVPVYAGEKVIDAMQTLSSTGQISFTSHEYLGMGLFIDSINGTKNAGGTYWILYINGTSSTVGASTASIKPGDVVEWRFEHNY